MCDEQQGDELNTRLKGKDIKHTDGFVYVDEMVTKNRHLYVGVWCQIQSVVNAWRKVKRVVTAGSYQKC